MRVQISESIIQQITQNAEASYPNECCGLIAGSNTGDNVFALHYWPLTNHHQENQKRRFLIHPKDYLDAEDRADEQGLAIVSIVHSHPDHPDKPSEFDRLHAWPGISYIIISVLGGKTASYRSWRLTEDRTRFNREDIQIGG